MQARLQVDVRDLVLDWGQIGIFRGENVMMNTLETDCPAQLNDDKHTVVGFEYKVSQLICTNSCVCPFVRACSVHVWL